jgi:hypothetical protein
VSIGGVPNCNGVSTEGLRLGLANGVDGAFVSNVNIGRSGQGFYAGVVDTGVGLITGYLTQFLNDTADGNGVGVLINAGLENAKWIGGSISGNLIGLSVTAGGSDLGFEYTSFDANANCAVSLTGDSDLTLKSDHFENPSGGTNCWMVATIGNVVWAYGDIFDDVQKSSISLETRLLGSLHSTKTMPNNLWTMCTAELLAASFIFHCTVQPQKFQPNWLFTRWRWTVLQATQQELPRVRLPF